MADEVRRFNGAEVLAADTDKLGQLLLREPLVLAVVGDVIAQLNVFLGVVKFWGGYLPFISIMPSLPPTLYFNK